MEKNYKRSLLALKERSPEVVVNFVVGILHAHYQRKVDNAQAQLKALKTIDYQELEDFWVALKKSAPTEDTLSIFTNWIESKIDGDGL